MPLIFQAKRYQRPYADISQVSAGIIPQRTLLQSNRCASAYIFYENAKDGIAHPLPALVKAAAAVGAANQTNVLSDSLDLASYLLVVLADPHVGRAASPKDALNMIYDRASFKKLATLMVVSSDATAGPRYQSACREVVVERAQDHEPPEEEYEPPIPTWHPIWLTNDFGSEALPSDSHNMRYGTTADGPTLSLGAAEVHRIA